MTLILALTDQLLERTRSRRKAPDVARAPARRVRTRLLRGHHRGAAREGPPRRAGTAPEGVYEWLADAMHCSSAPKQYARRGTTMPCCDGMRARGC